MEQTNAKTADTPVCKCGGRTALIGGMWYFSPDSEPYLNGVEEDSKVTEGEEYIHGFKCDHCGAMSNLFCDKKDYQSLIANLEAQKKELRSIMKDLLPMAKDGYKLHCKNCCHQDFLEDDREILSKAEQALKEDTQDG